MSNFLFLVIFMWSIPEFFSLDIRRQNSRGHFFVSFFQWVFFEGALVFAYCIVSLMVFDLAILF